MNVKKIALSLSMLGILGFASLGFAEAEKKGHGAVIIEITPKDVKAVELKDVEGGMELKGFSIARKKIKPGMARVALRKMKEELKPGEEVILGVAVVANGKTEACKLKLKMGENHQFSDAKVEECDVFNNAEIKQKDKKVFIGLKKA